MKKAIACFEKRAKRAAVMVRTNLCSPLFARSNERSISRALEARQKDLDSCRVELKTNELYLHRTALLVSVCFTLFTLLLLAFWTINRKQRNDFEHRLRASYQAGQNGGVRSYQVGLQEAPLTPVVSPQATSTHDLEDFSEEIERCLQQ